MKKPAVVPSPEKRPLSMLAIGENTGSLFLKPAPPLNPLVAGFGRIFVPSTDEEEEFRMTIETMGKKKPFNIFQDAPEDSPSLSRVPACNQPLTKHRPNRKLFGRPSVCLLAPQIQTHLRGFGSDIFNSQIRFSQSRFASISQQFDCLDPYPCLANPTGPANRHARLW